MVDEDWAAVVTLVAGSFVMTEAAVLVGALVVAEATVALDELPNILWGRSLATSRHDREKADGDQQRSTEQRLARPGSTRFGSTRLMTTGHGVPQ